LRQRADAMLQALSDAAVPGARAHDVASAGTDHDLGLGNGIGLRLVQPPSISIDSKDIITPDSVVSLRVRVREPDGTSILTSRMVRVAQEGNEWL
jgi:Xaa-Pro aminopeptidase